MPIAGGSTFLACMVICQVNSNCNVAVYVASSNKYYLKNATPANCSNMGACGDCTIGIIAVNPLISNKYY